jgi:hypothetical protein
VKGKKNNVKINEKTNQENKKLTSSRTVSAFFKNKMKYEKLKKSK